MQNKINELNNFFGSKAILLGTPLHTNIGDRAIAYAERTFLRDNNFSFVEIPFGAEIEDLEVKRDVVIFLHGGGNFGDIWFEEEIFRRKAISKFKENKMILMPQTIFFEDKAELRRSIEIYSSHNDLTLVAREETSYDIIRDKFKKNKVILSPDIVLYLKMNMKNDRSGVVFSIRDDKEKVFSDEQIFKLEESVSERFGSKLKHSDMHTTVKHALADSHKNITMCKMGEFSRAKLVVTDRLHAMIFCVLTRTPCVVLGSKTYKTKGIYNAWLKNLPYIRFCESVESAVCAIKDIDLEVNDGDLLDFSKYWDNVCKDNKSIESNPLISVIIPVYNVEKYIEDCLKSVINQTYENLEIIVVDDGSPDESYKIIEKFAKKDKRIKFIRQENRGLNGARETGFKASSGDFITFVDSDDIIDIDFIYESLNRMNDYIDMSICQYDIFTDSATSIKEYGHASRVLSKVEAIRGWSKGNLGSKIFPQTAWGKIYRRHLIEAVDWDRSNYRINEDEFMSTMIYSAIKGDVLIIDSPLYFYRKRVDSITSNYKEKPYTNSYKGQAISRSELFLRMSKFRVGKFPEFRREIFDNFYYLMIDEMCRKIRGSDFDIGLALNSIGDFLSDKGGVHDDSVEVQKEGIIRHGIYMLSLVESDTILMGEIIEYLQEEVWPKFNIDENIEGLSSVYRQKMEAILRKDLFGFMEILLSEKNEMLKQCKGQIDGLEKRLNELVFINKKISDELNVLSYTIECKKSVKGSVRNVLGAIRRYAMKNIKRSH